MDNTPENKMEFLDSTESETVAEPDNQNSVELKEEKEPERAENDFPIETIEETQNEPVIEQQEEKEPFEETVITPVKAVGNYYYNNDFNEPKPTPQKKQKARFSFATVIVSVVLSLLVGVGTSVFLLGINNQKGAPNNSNNSGTITKNEIVSTSENLGVVEAVYKKAGPSVVGIRATVNSNSFFESTGDGSGVIYSEDGYIITNYHVIAGGSSSGFDGNTTYSGIASKIDVYLSSDTETAIPAKVIGYNSAYDIAVIKIDKKGLTAINIGDSKKLNVGQFVVAIGSPGGLQFMSSVTYGVIGGLNRTLQVESETVGLIQTDAAINPGNSGGALVDTKGNLIGINSSKLVDTSYEGMGFAIPVNEVVEMCERIIESGNSATPYIGIEVSTAYDADTLKALGFPTGAVVSSVTSGGPADKAGLQRADIITKFNGKEIKSFETFRNILSKCKPEETVPIEVFRGGKTYQTTITIGTNNQVE